MRQREDWTARAAIEEGHAVPDSSLDLDAPDLRIDLEFFLVAYEQLSTTRPPSFGDPRPLSWQALREYAERYGVEDFEDFCEIINGVDREFLAYLDSLEQEKTGEENDRTRNPSSDRPSNGPWGAARSKRPRKR